MTYRRRSLMFFAYTCCQETSSLLRVLQTLIKWISQLKMTKQVLFTTKRNIVFIHDKLAVCFELWTKLSRQFCSRQTLIQTENTMLIKSVCTYLTCIIFICFNDTIKWWFLFHFNSISHMKDMKSYTFSTSWKIP